MKKSSKIVMVISILALLGIEISISRLNVTAGWSGGTIYIRADGSVEPSSAPIRRDGETYVLTEDIEVTSGIGILVMKDNVVIDGKNHLLKGGGYGDGMYLVGRRGVVIKDMRIQNFYHGIYIESSYNNKIAGNSIENNTPYGIYLYNSPNNEIAGNSIENNNQGIYLDNSSDNKIFDNDIKNNWNGIYLSNSLNNKIAGNSIERNKSNGLSLDGSSSNEVTRNSIENNGRGVSILYSSNNKIYNNNFTNNVKQILTYQSVNFWDDGSRGNYWSDYEGVDSDNDGIGDAPYVIDDDNKDNCPLVRLYLIFVNVSTPYGTVTGSGWYEVGVAATISMDQTFIDHGNGTRRVFKGWVENNTLISINQSFSIIADRARIIVAIWDTEYEVKAVSERGTITGSGWYRAGSTATVSINPAAIEEGLFSKHVFVGWRDEVEGNFISTSQNYSFTVTKPMNLVVVWSAETNLAAIGLMFGAALLIIVLVVLVIVRKRTPQRINRPYGPI